MSEELKKSILELYNKLDNTKTNIKKLEIYKEINEKLSEVIYQQHLDIIKYKTYYNNAIDYRKNYYQKNKDKIQQTSKNQYEKKKQENNKKDTFLEKK